MIKQKNLRKYKKNILKYVPFSIFSLDSHQVPFRLLPTLGECVFNTHGIVPLILQWGSHRAHEKPIYTLLIPQKF